MEFADGGDLMSVINKQKKVSPINFFSEDQIWIYFFDICQGLNYCHKGGIIHRDLTPSNILLSNGVLKLTDFGISR